MSENNIKIAFFDVFYQNVNGSLTPKIPIALNGISFGPGVSFSRGVTFGGVDFFSFYGKSISGVYENGVLHIKGFYNQ